MLAAQSTRLLSLFVMATTLSTDPSLYPLSTRNSQNVRQNASEPICGSKLEGPDERRLNTDQFEVQPSYRDWELEHDPALKVLG
jgi:hypothetical protein